MKNTKPRELASMFASIFMYAQDDLTREEVARFTPVFTDTLLVFGDSVAADWPTISTVKRLAFTLDTASVVLFEQLTDLYERLGDYERFLWKAKLCRLLLSYVESRLGLAPDPAISRLFDYSKLVRDAVGNADRYCNYLLDPETWEIADDRTEPLQVPYFLN